ncbi:hypothetical protein [Kitasatospora sp. HPMI-4]|uniref:hypothetical protein n=1 Tax=Kitasatospora sp. HPMI-4 TaxID=3448443 RepID=UPI003F1E16A2
MPHVRAHYRNGRLVRAHYRRPRPCGYTTTYGSSAASSGGGIGFVVFLAVLAVIALGHGWLTVSTPTQSTSHPTPSPTTQHPSR